MSISDENELRRISYGFDRLINPALKLTSKKSYDTKSGCYILKPTDEIREGIEDLVSDLYKQIEKNRRDRPPYNKSPSKINWQLRRKIELEPEKNYEDRKESLLETSIATIAGDKNNDLLDDWFNQMSTASGLMNSKKDRRAAVDLVHLKDNQLELVELKWKSNYPLYAIFEILCYGLVYLFSYNNKQILGYQNLETMKVSNIILSTLAPVGYYSDCDFQWLVDDLQSALKSLFKKKCGDDLSCEFKCYAFPEEFDPQFTKIEEVLKNESYSSDDPIFKYIAKKFNCRSAVEWNKS